MASHFGIVKPLWIHVFSRRDLGPHFFSFYSLLCPKIQFADPLRNPVGVQMAPQICQATQKHQLNQIKVWTFRDFESDSLPKSWPKSHRGSFWMTCYGYWDPLSYLTWQWEQIPPNRQAPNSMQNARRELAKNFVKLVRASVHFETVQGILRVSKHQPQLTSSYKIRWRQCARRMAHRDMI